MRPGFTAKYGLTKLVWFEAFEFRDQAFRRQRQMKEWQRRWKVRLIEEVNPRWDDLYERLPTLIGLVTP
jgi:putative endonuclease